MIRLWTRALPPAEINQNFTAPPANRDALVGEWLFAGGTTADTSPMHNNGTLVAVNTLNRGGPHGDFILLNSHRIVHPLRLAQPGFEHYRPIDWRRQCHRKAGLVASARFPGDEMFPDSPAHYSVDALAWTPAIAFARDVMPMWYSHLNKRQGENLVILGGSGKASNAWKCNL